MNRLLFSEWVEEARNGKDDFVVFLIQKIIVAASNADVSDLHFQPSEAGMEIWYRFNGVLHELGSISSEYIDQTAARLKVLADLLTYQTAIPQEGRVQAGRVAGVAKEMRVSSMPTLFGERVVVRFFAEEKKYQFPDQLGFSPTLERELIHALNQNGGAIVVCGPAGSGKTTTAYSLIRRLTLRDDEIRSIITLEDPIERPIPRTAQVEVASRGETSLSLPTMIKYTLRQDPEVLLIGEIRDSSSAAAALQAALTGHLLITTFHAGSVAEAIGRLSEMGIEPFVLRSGINVVICQRLLRRLCDCARRSSERLTLTLHGRTFELDDYRLPVGCDRCSHSGYRDRVVVAESIPWNDPLVSRAVLDRRDTVSLQKIAEAAGMKTIAENAIELVRQGITSPQEVVRVLGMKREQ